MTVGNVGQCTLLTLGAGAVGTQTPRAALSLSSLRRRPRRRHPYTGRRRAGFAPPLALVALLLGVTGAFARKHQPE